jgi:hypothetical protein
VADNLDLAFGGLEDGLKRACSLVFAIEQDPPDELFDASGILHRGVGIADRDAATEKRSRPVLNVLHLLELAEKVGAYLPQPVWKRLSKPKPRKMKEAGSLEGISTILEVAKCTLAGGWKQSSFESAVERSGAIRGQLRLLLVLDLLECAWTKLPGQGTLDCLSQSTAYQFSREDEFFPGTEPATHNDMGVRMVRVAMDDSAPLDLAINVTLNAGDKILGSLAKICFLILWRDDDLEKAFVAGLLPVPGNRTEGTLFCDPEFLFALAFPVVLRALTFNIETVRFPAAWSAGTGIANIDNSAALESRRLWHRSRVAGCAASSGRAAADNARQAQKVSSNTRKTRGGGPRLPDAAGTKLAAPFTASAVHIPFRRVPRHDCLSSACWFLGIALQSQLAEGVGPGVSTPLELARGREVDLFVDQGSSGARAGQQRLWHFGQSRQSVLDIAVGQREMELRDGLKALELVREIVGEIPKGA